MLQCFSNSVHQCYSAPISRGSARSPRRRCSSLLHSLSKNRTQGNRPSTPSAASRARSFKTAAFFRISSSTAHPSRAKPSGELPTAPRNQTASENLELTHDFATNLQRKQPFPVWTPPSPAPTRHPTDLRFFALETSAAARQIAQRIGTLGRAPRVRHAATARATPVKGNDSVEAP